MEHGIWLTVITVVRNDEAGFRRTLSSLQGQNLGGVQYVVIDSSDDRHEIPGLLRDSELTADYQWREPAGIYAAMNEGIALAHGRYCYFANAGDTLVGTDVLNRVKASTLGDPEWLFGPVEITSTNGITVITPPWNYREEQAHCFSRGHFPCHQGTFVRTESLRALGGFSNEYSIVSDYAIFLELSLRSDPVFLEFVIANFSEGGISTVRWRKSLSEFHRARVRILQPKGIRLVRERWNSMIGYLRMLAYRSFISKVSRSST